MIFAADRCRERSPNFYVADSLSEISEILNPRLGDVVMLVIGGVFNVWRLEDSEATPDGFGVIESNACEYVWINAGPSGSGGGGSGFITPQLFGALADGATDDTVAINLAIAAAVNGILYFPGGTYRHSSTIELPDTITILGPGLLQEIGVLAPQLRITANDVVIEGLQLEGVENSGTWSSTPAVIQERCNIIVDGDDCIINRVVMSEKSCGIKITGDRVKVFQCKASNSWLQRDPTFVSNFHYSHAYLLYDDTGGGPAVGGVIEECSSVFGYGQGIGTVGNDLSVLGCTVINTLNNGIYNSGGDRCKYNDNTVIDPYDNGITARGSQNEISNNTVRGTLSATDALRRGNVGIVVTAHDAVASPGTPEETYSTVMGANFNGFGNVVTGNKVYEFSVRGIEAGQLSTSGGIYTHGTVIEGNTVFNCGSGDNDESDPIGILAYGHAHRIIGNSLFSILPVVGPKTPYGIEVTGNGAFRSVGVLVEGNDIDGGGLNNTGIVLLNTEDCTIRGNLIMNQAGHGMQIIDCIGPVIHGNEFPDLDVFFDTTPSSVISVKNNKGFAIGFNVNPTSGVVCDNDVPNISLIAGLKYSINERTDNDWASVSGASSEDYEIKFNGALSVKRNAQAAGYVMTATDMYVVITSTGNCTLPGAFTVGVGRMVIVKSANGVTTTVIPAFGDNVDSGVSDILGSLAAGRYISDGGFNWEKV